MSFTIRIRDRMAFSMDGQYVRHYDARGPASISPDGFEMDCWLEVTPSENEALQFPTIQEAWKKYREADGLRDDGEPNRPLTAFSVEITEGVKETAEDHNYVEAR